MLVPRLTERRSPFIAPMRSWRGVSISVSRRRRRVSDKRGASVMIFIFRYKTIVIQHDESHYAQMSIARFCEECVIDLSCIFLYDYRTNVSNTEKGSP